MSNKSEKPSSRYAAYTRLEELDIPLWFDSSGGIIASTHVVSLDEPTPFVNGKPWKFKEEIVTDVHFLPGNRNKFDPAKRSDSLLQAVNGLNELVQTVDANRFKVAPTLLGHTNLRMALIAQRMGFVIADDSRLEITECGKHTDDILILARYEDVARKTREFVGSDALTRLAARVLRLEMVK